MTETSLIRIQTFTGKLVNLDTITEDDIDIIDIAHSLAMQCRFNGHCRDFYSVAQHSVLSSILCREIPPEGLEIENQRRLLMHDAAEAYIGDIIRPIKKHSNVNTIFTDYETRIMKVIGSKYGFNPEMTEFMKTVDNRMLFTEKRDIMVPCEWSWNCEPFLPDYPIVPWDPFSVRRIFLYRFADLFPEKVDPDFFTRYHQIVNGPKIERCDHV